MGLFPPEQEKKLVSGLKMDLKNKQIFGDNIQSAEQYRMLAKAGYVKDLRTKKNKKKNINNGNSSNV